MLTRHGRIPIAHRAVVHGETIYLAGMVADDKSLSIGGQTRQSLEKIDAMLKELGSDAAHLLHVAIYVTDIADRDELNAAWMKFFDSEMLPTRALVGVKELGPGTLVELVATAAVFNHAE